MAVHIRNLLNQTDLSSLEDIDFKEFLPHILSREYLKIPGANPDDLEKIYAARFIDPSFGFVIFSIQKYHPVLEYILNNWFQFYHTTEEFLFDLIPIITRRSYRVPMYNNDMFKQINLIQFLNDNPDSYDRDTILSGNYPYAIHYFIDNHDINCEYKIFNVLQFFSVYIQNPDLLLKKYNQYSKNIVEYNGSSRLLEICLDLGYEESYMILVNCGLKLESLKNITGSKIRLDAYPEILQTFDHLYPMDLLEFIKIGINTLSAFGQLRTSLFKQALRFIEYGGTFGPIEFEIINENFSRYKLDPDFICEPPVFHLISRMYGGKHDKNISSQKTIEFEIIKEYDMDLFFKYTPKTCPIKTWKFNMKIVLNMERQF